MKRVFSAILGFMLLSFFSLSVEAGRNNQDKEENSNATKKSLRNFKEKGLGKENLPPTHEHLSSGRGVNASSNSVQEKPLSPAHKRKCEDPKDLQTKKSRLNDEDRLTNLNQSIQTLHQRIQTVFQKPQQWKDLFQIYEEFLNLTFPLKLWKGLAEQLKKTAGERALYVWPSQKNQKGEVEWKKVIGGYLFHPPFTNQWADSLTIETRRWSSNFFGMGMRYDVTWAFTLAAKFGHPISKYYLAKTLDNVWQNNCDINFWNGESKPPFIIKRLYHQALKDLIQCKDNPHPDGCFVMGWAYKHDCHFFLKGSIDRALEWHTRGAQLGDLRSAFQILEIKDRLKNCTPPSADDYLDLARKGYLPAYLLAQRAVEEDDADKRQDKRLKILEEAAQKGYGPALRVIGAMYEGLYEGQMEEEESSEEEEGEKREKQEKRKIDDTLLIKARAYYQQAGEKGDAEGYLSLAKSYLGDYIYGKGEYEKDLKTLPTKDIEKTAQALRLAGETHNLDGWKELAQLYSVLGREEKKKADALEQKITEKRKKKCLIEAQRPYLERKKEYQNKAEEAMEKGMALGYMYELGGKALEELTDKNLFCPIKKIYQNIEEVLNKKD